LVESGDEILGACVQGNLAFLVVGGDPFGATTYTDLYLCAHQQGIKVKMIHNASILNAIGICGLQLYSYGPSISIPYFTPVGVPIRPT
jgi:diphthine synthase